jgi:hypothetical protein
VNADGCSRCSTSPPRDLTNRERRGHHRVKVGTANGGFSSLLNVERPFPDPCRRSRAGRTNWHSFLVGAWEVHDAGRRDEPHLLSCSA